MRDWIVLIAGVLIILGIAGSITYHTYTLGSNQDDYEIVCIYGHEYYRANFMTKIALSIKLNDYGKPFKCE